MDIEHNKWLARCGELARSANRAGETPVGSVIVRDGNLIAEAAEHVRAPLDLTGHAELLAIRQACRRLESLKLFECTLYTNMEPCWMCALAIRESEIQTVVIGTAISDIGGATSGYPILTDANIPGWGVPPGILWADTSALRPPGRHVTRNERHGS